MFGRADELFACALFDRRMLFRLRADDGGRLQSGGFGGVCRGIQPERGRSVLAGGREKSVLDNTIEQEMMLDSECRTQFIFAEEKEIYKL